MIAATMFVCPECRLSVPVSVWPLRCRCGKVYYTASESAGDVVPPCVHRGDLLELLTDKKECGCGNEGVEVWRCEKFGETVLRRKVERAGRQRVEHEHGFAGRYCVTCPARQAKPERSRKPWRAEPRDITSLVAVTSYYNPRRYQSRLQNWWAFAENLALQGVELITAEVSTDGEFQLPADRTIRLHADSLLWHKEASLNVAIREAADQYDAIAWLDCDVLFDRHDWAAATRDVLQEFDVVQPFERIEYIDHDKSDWWDWRQSMGRSTSGHPGFAWAARSEFLRRGGLFDVAIFGGADITMAKAWKINDPSQGTPQTLRAAARRWASTMATGDVGFTPGTIRHLPHGKHSNRKYQWRVKRLDALGFDPGRHLERQENGLWRWSDEAPPELVTTVADYFAMRKEDELCNPT